MKKIPVKLSSKKLSILDEILRLAEQESHEMAEEEEIEESKFANACWETKEKNQVIKGVLIA